MQRIRIGVLGAGPLTEWAILPALSGPDALTPPDQGAWWSRRPSGSGDIAYQPPARPEVVALAGADPHQLRRVASAARVGAVYDDWKLMLRETPLDALLCPWDGDRLLGLSVEEILAEAGDRVRWIWLDGPPAFSVEGARALQRQARGRRARLWCARPLRRAAAHRAALRLAREKQIGEITALTLRWGGTLRVAPPEPGPSRDEAGRGEAGRDEAGRETLRRFASSYAALDLLLAGGAATSTAATAAPLQAWAAAHGGATSLGLRTAGGVLATALFATADSWSSPLPRMEMCGTQGRALVCEAGRRVWLHQPGLAAHLLEPPGLAPHLSSAGSLGVAEDLNAYLAACAEEKAPRLDLESGTEYSALWPDAARVLQLGEALDTALATGRLSDMTALEAEPHGARAESGALPNVLTPDAPAPGARDRTLPLQLL
jgi:predicted dehydrogenase